MISQGAHASTKIFLDLITKLEPHNIGGYTATLHITEQMKTWMDDNYKKITVSVDSEQELIDIYNQANDAGIPVCLITDSGLTEFHGVETKTCVAIGPDNEDIINKITGNLKLL